VMFRVCPIRSTIPNERFSAGSGCDSGWGQFPQHSLVLVNGFQNRPCSRMRTWLASAPENLGPLALAPGVSVADQLQFVLRGTPLGDGIPARLTECPYATQLKE
jgi:hypothetical protein